MNQILYIFDKKIWYKFLNGQNRYTPTGFVMPKPDNSHYIIDLNTIFLNLVLNGMTIVIWTNY